MDEKEKERTRSAPYLLYNRAVRHFYGAEVSRKLRIRINLKNDPKPLTLFYGGLSLGEPNEKHYAYNKKGTDLYQDLMPDFDDIQVELDTGEVEHFADLDALVKEAAKA